MEDELGSEPERLGGGLERGELVIPLRSSPQRVTGMGAGGAGGSTGAYGNQSTGSQGPGGGEVTLPEVPALGTGWIRQVGGLAWGWRAAGGSELGLGLCDRPSP